MREPASPMATIPSNAIGRRGLGRHAEVDGAHGKWPWVPGTLGGCPLRWYEVGRHAFRGRTVRWYPLARGRPGIGRHPPAVDGRHRLGAMGAHRERTQGRGDVLGPRAHGHGHGRGGECVEDARGPGRAHVRGRQQRHLVVVESANPSSRAALLRVLNHLPGGGLLVPTSLDPASLGARGTSTEVDLGGDHPRLGDVGAVVAAGHYTGLGGAMHAWAARRGARFVTVQHGLLTPHAPPLAPGTALLAWSAADAEFWRSDRDDVTTHVVGSQLLREAAARPATVDPDDRPVFLGQLHGAELSRWGMARTAGGFCRATGATYRPHPSERRTAR